MSSPPISNIPIVLFPLKIETRFVDVPINNNTTQHELWIRAFPDIAFIQSHDPRLTEEERKDANAFKQISNGTTEKKKEFWETLVSKYGVYRAAWVVQVEQTEIDRQTQHAAATGERAEDEENAFFLKCLPDRLVFSLYKKEQKNPAYEVDGGDIKEEVLTLLGEEDDWLLDFDKALTIGMGVKIVLEPTDTEFQKIIVSGFHKSGNRLSTSKGLSDLLRNHQHTEGCSFLQYGTPTNNTSTAKSGYSAKDEFDALNSFEYAVEGLDLNNQTESAAAKLAKDLGIENSTFENVEGADIKPSKFIEIYQKATWFALGAQPLFMLFGDNISSEMHQELWEHYTQFVNAKGRHNALKIGNQPYGILPVMNVRRPLIKDDGGIDSSIRNSDELFNKMWTLFAVLLERWLEMTKKQTRETDATVADIPRLGDEEDTYLEILKILSMQAASSSYQIRPLEYEHFQKRWHRWLRQLRPTPSGSTTTSLDILLQDTNTIFKRDYEATTQNVNSIQSLFKAVPIYNNTVNNSNETAISNRVNLMNHFKLDDHQLFDSALLSFFEGNDALIGFEKGEAQLVKTEEVETDEGSKLEIVSEVAKDPFSFTQENLEAFQKFIQHLEAGTTEDLLEFQYEGELSLFTDLLLRSYSNGGQLYYRDITYSPSSAEIRSIPILQIGKILKEESASVKRGDAILEINRIRETENLEPILVTAPFDGKIEKIKVATGDDFLPNRALFSLKNEAKHQALKKEFIKIGKTLLEEFNAMGEDTAAKKAAQNEALREVLDLNSYRLDAWISSLANRRIVEMRAHQTEHDDYSKGIYFGAYAWIENLKKNAEQVVNVQKEGNVISSMTVDYQEDGGIIHTPSAAQATASAIFKNAFLFYREEEKSNPFALNLTSDRIQKSTTLLNGIREGQQLEALLGYRLERFLHEHPKTEKQKSIYDGDLHEEIYLLREIFPLYENVTSEQTGFVNLSVIDGSKAIENKANLQQFLPNLQQKKVQILQHYITQLEDILDASLDTLFYESGYQVTQGNLSHSAAALDAIKGAIEPPAIESLKTKIPGVGISHQLVMTFKEVENTYDLQNCRALTEPVLEKWLEEHIGKLENIGCEVDLLHPEDDRLIESIPVKLSDLNVGYLDLMYWSESPVEDGASELELRIWKAAQAQQTSTFTELKYKITTFAPSNTQALVQALEIFRYTSAFLDKCRPLESDDLTMSGENIHYNRAALDEIRDERFLPILQALQIAENADLSQVEHLKFLAQLDIEAAKIAYLMGDLDNVEALKTEVQQKNTSLNAALTAYELEEDFKTAFEYLQQMAKTLFGGNFLLLPPALASENFELSLNAQAQEKLVGEDTMSSNEQVWGQTRIENWVQGLAQVHENSEYFEDWLMVGKVWGEIMDLEQAWNYQIVQGPTLIQYPWIALSKVEIDAVLQAKHQSSSIFKDKTTGESFPLSDGTYYPDSCESTVIFANENFTFDKNANVFGLVIEEFTEHIPNEKVNTAVSFHYNAPNSEAPQAILLAIHPQAMMDSDFHWEEKDIRDIIYDTMDLYKIRMVDLEAMQEYGYVLPMTHWMNITN